MADHPQPSSDQTVEALQKQVASLQQLVEQQAKREDVQRGAFDQLYAELKQ